MENGKGIRQRVDDYQFLRRDAIEQHPRSLPGVRANIDNVAQFADMTRRKKRETTLFGIEREAVALEPLSRRKSPADVAELLPILHKIDNAAGQNEFEKALQTDSRELDACAAPFLSSAKMRRPAAVCSALATTTVRVLPTCARA